MFEIFVVFAIELEFLRESIVIKGVSARHLVEVLIELITVHVSVKLVVAASKGLRQIARKFECRVWL